jgi:hypothetical protein
MKFWNGVLLGVMALAALPAAATQVHGATDVFTSPEVKLAWAIARGPDEARTMVVVRMRVAPSIQEVAVTGVDPFGGARKVAAQAKATKGKLEIRISRASFVDFPKTEWQFVPGMAEKPFTVFYLGIPDTTPEFADESKLDAYLEARLGKL